MKSKLPGISEAEWEVMKVIWKSGPCTAQVVIDALSGPNAWTVSTIKTLLGRLLAKGALSHEKSGKAFVYAAVHGEADYRAAEADSFLDRFFDGALSPLFAHFASTRKLRKQDIDGIEQILRASKRKQ
jgi:BlaI family penicillinase repressor